MSLSSDIPLETIDGKAETLRAFDGKALLIVNVASKCGFTPQYAGLEALHKRFRDRGFAVLGFPCDQFGHQEPGDEAEIAKFCSLTYDVSFPMFAKIEVNGPNAHPLYKALKKEAPGCSARRRSNGTSPSSSSTGSTTSSGATPRSTSRNCSGSTSRRCCKSVGQGSQLTRRALPAQSAGAHIISPTNVERTDIRGT